MTLAKRVADNIQRIRKSRGLSQLDLAKSANIRQPQVSGIERGDIQPTLVTLEALSKALDVEPYELLINPELDDQSLKNKLISISQLAPDRRASLELTIDLFLKESEKALAKKGK